MTLDKAELIIHPVRLRILEALLDGPQTTGELAKRLPDIPKSSLYRHIKLLLGGEVIAVAEARMVQGIEEKVYTLNQPPRLKAEDLAVTSAEDHLRYFTTYVITLIQGFADYLTGALELDLITDRVGYNEAIFWASEDEFDAFSDKLNSALQPLLDQKAVPGRRKRKIAVVTHPLKERVKENE